MSIILLKPVYKRGEMCYNKWVRKKNTEAEYALIKGII